MAETPLAQSLVEAIEAAEKLAKSLKAIRDIVVGGQVKPEKGPDEQEPKSSTQ